MGKTKFTLNDQLLREDIRAFAYNYCKTIAEESKYYIWEFARKQITEYYAEYEPLYYDPRTNQELNYSFHYFSEKTGGGYRGGIVFDNSVIWHKNAGVDKDYIERMVWRLGYHGWQHARTQTKGRKKQSNETPPWIPINGEPQRFEKINNYIKGADIDGEIFPIEKIKGIAWNKAKKQKYTMLKFM